MRKVSQDESFVFVSSNWRRNHFTHFTRRLIERRESEIMIDYLSNKYNYMLQNGGKYLLPTTPIMWIVGPLIARTRKVVERRLIVMKTKLSEIESYPIVDHFNNY